MSSKTDNKAARSGGDQQHGSFESGVSLEQDQASVQKLQHLSTALKHLQVNRVKEKHERQTLSTLFQEEKDRKDQLSQLNKKFTYNLQVLRKRLEDNNLPSNLDGKTDAIRPQPPKQLLKDLMQENAELKQQLTECSNYNKPLKETQLQRIHELEEILEREVYEKGLFEDRIKQLGTASNNEKDTEIARLEDEIKLMKDNSNVQEVLSQSLMDEVVNVNHRLQSTAKIYQEVVIKLTTGEHVEHSEDIEESLKSLPVRFPQRKSAPTTSQTSQSTSDGQDAENAEKENKKLKSENIKMKSDLSEAVDVNKRWNSYNQQREIYVKKQQEKITQLETRFQLLQERNGGAEDTKKLEAELEKMKVESGKALKTVRDLKSRIQIVTEQKDVYQSRNRELMQSMENSPWYRELKDTVYHIQAQLQASTEDFQNERRDRENAQGKLSELELQLAYYKRYESSGGHYGGAVDLRSLEREQLSQYTAYGRCGPAYNVAQQHRPQIVSHSPGVNVEHSLGVHVDTVPGSSDSDTNSGTNNSGSGRGLAQALSSATRGDQDLQCPRCHKSFPSGQHQQLLEHMDTCCD